MGRFTLLRVTLDLRVSLPDRTRVGRISDESDGGSRRAGGVKEGRASGRRNVVGGEGTGDGSRSGGSGIRG
jgi:hypothetical protein